MKIPSTDASKETPKTSPLSGRSRWKVLAGRDEDLGTLEALEIVEQHRAVPLSEDVVQNLEGQSWRRLRNRLGVGLVSQRTGPLGLLLDAVCGRQ